MPVSGQELASLDFSNLIGGPINAVVEAQAKAAITTANFIQEVGFDEKGEVKNVDFSYNRKNDDGEDQEFSLTLPFITMLPIPYISITRATVDFNAKITSTTESSMSDELTWNAKASARGKFWFRSARVASNTAYQRDTASSDSEQRTFDMAVHVEMGNTDLPTGTERILNLLENTIAEKKGSVVYFINIEFKKLATSDAGAAKLDGATVSVSGGSPTAQAKIEANGTMNVLIDGVISTIELGDYDDDSDTYLLTSIVPVPVNISLPEEKIVADGSSADDAIEASQAASAIPRLTAKLK